MIRTKEDLAQYLADCRIAYGRPARRTLKLFVSDLLLPDNNYEYMRNLCYCEYLANIRGGGGGYNR